MGSKRVGGQELLTDDEEHDEGDYAPRGDVGHRASCVVPQRRSSRGREAEMSKQTIGDSRVAYSQIPAMTSDNTADKSLTRDRRRLSSDIASNIAQNMLRQSVQPRARLDEPRSPMPVQLHTIPACMGIGAPSSKHYVERV